MQQLTFILILFPVLLVTCEPLPSLENTSKDPIFALVDEEVFVDCTVTNIQNYTLVWRFSSQSDPVNSPINVNFESSETISASSLAKPSAKAKGEVLTAGFVRVTNDNRFSVIHEKGANTWALHISKAKASDSGVYTCELNTEPIRKISRIVMVSDEVEEPNSGSVKSILEVEHNYTACCAAEKVPKICHQFCNFRGLISPSDSGAVGNGAIQTCINYLPSITKCLADGRDHMPCCVKQNIPDPCRPVCVGNFTLTTVLDHFTCMSYTAPVLACIAEGVQILPPKPRLVTIEPTSTTTIKVNWAHPLTSKSAPNVDSYQINITQLHSFDAIGTAKIAPAASPGLLPEPSLYGLQMRYTVSANDTQFLISDLKPYTMYEITMRSVNKAGFSLPIDPLRTLTLNTDESSDSSSSSPSKPRSKSRPEGDDSPSTGERETDSSSEREVEDESTTKKSSVPKLPDMKACCRKNGVTIDRCVDVLCDPVRADQASLTDLMICAPWANVTFKCMANSVDHSNCCRQRGVGGSCLEFCSGTLKKLDYRHFVCLEHMSTFSSCVLDHFGVLPSVPRNFMVVNVHHDWAILKWLHPHTSKNTPRDSMLKYLVHWRDVSKSDEISPYNVTIASTAPFLLDRLSPGGRYEVYVKTANQYGTSSGSTRVVFSTPPLTSASSAEAEASSSNQMSPGYNETQCCMRAGIGRNCLPLCSYRVKVTDVITKGASCSSNLPELVRCGAGGRNHIPCCRRRSVADGCLNLCAGLVESSPFVVAARCADEMGKILQCMEEGSGLIPGMPADFHATLVTKDSIHLAWDPAPEDVNSSILYQVRYGKTEEDIPLHPLEHDKSLNRTSTNAIVNGLSPNTRYSFYVVASNSFGISLPSLVLVINTSSNDDSSTSLVKSNVGPPHSIQLLHQSVDSITLKWLPPLYVPPDSRIRYVVHYKPVNGTAAGSKTLDELEAAPWTMKDTSYNTIFLNNLTYDSEYAVAIQAVSQKDSGVKSSLSEVVLVWTDPAIPASVNLPVIIPAGPIYEGANVTFMCIGTGTPTPQLSMLLNGHEVMREERRHISLTVIGVQRNLTSVTCFSSNGFGAGSQATLDLRIRFKPSVIVHGEKESMAASNAPGRLQCEFTGNPMPHVVWLKEVNNGAKPIQITQDNRISFVTVAHTDSPLTWINSLVFTSLKPDDGGVYHCSVVNDLGQDSVDFSLSVDHSRNYTNNASGCCLSLGVSEECRKVCTFDVDIDAALLIPQCYPDMDKLMTCAADGSDHRQCCRRRNVPTDCIRWCAGLKVTRTAICSLSASQDIVSCFAEGKALLPGPPEDLHVSHLIDGNKAIIEWSPPKKNPELVKYYRIFWRPVGSRDLNKTQTDKPVFELEGLDSTKMYEFVVKSGNHYGLSIFTDPLVFSTDSSRTSSMASTILRIITGMSITAFVIVAIGAVGFYAYRNHLPTIQSIRLRSSLSSLHNNNNNNNDNDNNNSRGVSFENPSYLKDNGPVVQFSPPSNVEVNANFSS